MHKHQVSYCQWRFTLVSECNAVCGGLRLTPEFLLFTDAPTTQATACRSWRAQRPTVCTIRAGHRQLIALVSAAGATEFRKTPKELNISKILVLNAHSWRWHFNASPSTIFNDYIVTFHTQSGGNPAWSVNNPIQPARMMGWQGISAYRKVW